MTPYPSSGAAHTAVCRRHPVRAFARQGAFAGVTPVRQPLRILCALQRADVFILGRAVQALSGPQQIPELDVLKDNWQAIREEAMHLFDEGYIRAAEKNNDAGFGSFFKKGWKRFYLKW